MGSRKFHLVESCSFPRNTYKNVTNEEKFQPLVESAKKFMKAPVLNESFIKHSKKVLTESKIDSGMCEKIMANLQESGANTESIELWQFPISKINDHDHPNLNGRVYGRKLWENVVNNQADVWKGGTGLANHPADDEDGDFMAQSIVWLDGFLGDDGIVYGIGTFVGEGGALARQIIGVGGRVGFSTSGYGDFLPDGIEVDPDDYEIDRFADLVLNPSQGVYGDSSDKYKKESVENTNTNKLTESVEHKEEEEEDETTLSEKLVVEHYVKAIDEINKKSNKFWEEKIQDLEKLTKKLKKEAFNAKSKSKLNNQISSLIESIMKDTRKAIQEGYDARKFCEELSVTSLDKLSNIKEKIEDFASLEECLAKATKEAKKYKELYESQEDVSIRTAHDSFTENKKNEALNTQITELKKSLTESKNTGKDLKKKLEKSTESATLIGKQNIQLQESLDNANDEIDSLKERIVSLNTTIKKYKIKEKADSIQSQMAHSKVLKESQAFKEQKAKEMKILSAKVDVLSHRNTQLKDLLTEAEKTIKTLKQKVNVAKGNISESRVDIVKSQQRIEALQKENSELHKRHSSLTKNFNEMSARNERIAEQLEELRESSRQEREIFESKLNALKEAKEMDKNSFEERIESLKEANSNAMSSLERRYEKILEDKNREWSKKVSKLESGKKVEENRKARYERLAKRNLAEAEEPVVDDVEGLFRDSQGISDYLDEIDATPAEKAAAKEVKTVEELQNRSLFSNELLSDEAEFERGEIRRSKDTPSSLADMFI